MKLFTAGLAAGLAAVSLLPNVARADIYMVSGQQTAQTGIITGLTPGSTTSVVYQGGKPVAKSLTANACGFLTISDTWPAAAIGLYNTESFPEAHAEYMAVKVNGAAVSFDATTPTIATAPTCTGTTALPSSGVRMMVLPDRKIVIKGLTPGAVAITYKAPIAKNIKVNTCGLAVVKAPTLLTGIDLSDPGNGGVYIAGMDFGNREGDMELPVCRKNTTGGGTLYVKAPTN